jgi:hypothetical protein
VVATTHRLVCIHCGDDKAEFLLYKRANGQIRISVQNERAKTFKKKHAWAIKKILKECTGIVEARILALADEDEEDIEDSYEEQYMNEFSNEVCHRLNTLSEVIVWCNFGWDVLEEDY